MRLRLPAWAWALFVGIATLAAHAPVLKNEFTSYDDNVYVLENEHVRTGLNGANVAWALTSTYAGNWHPITWWSHMTQCQLWGLSPLGHHATSLVLHVANALLLFAALKRLTGSVSRSAVAAAMFGVHPLQVETVAWAAEQKSLLCTAFWWLALLAYAAWREAPSSRRKATVVAASAAALMAKPMAVTLPFTLLLLDVWPLRRVTLGPGGRETRRAAARGLIREKLWLFSLSAVSCAVTLRAEHNERGIRSLQSLPLWSRAANAVVSYARYLEHAAWPARLAALYPHPGTHLSAGTVAAAAAVLAAASWLAWRLRASRPYVAVGWLWYLGTLVPVLGLVQVGAQAMADRYAYVPLVGLFVAVTWGAADAARSVDERMAAGPRRAPASRKASIALAAVAGAGVIGLAARARAQAAVWHDTQTLFEHAIRVTGVNPVAHVILGLDDSKNGRLDRAREHYEIALRSRPWDADIHNNLGTALARQGKVADSIVELETAVRLKPDYGIARANLAASYLLVGRSAEARDQLHAARQAGFEPPAALVREILDVAPATEPRPLP